MTTPTDYYEPLLNGDPAVTDGIDWRRFPVESQWAIEHGASPVLVEQVEPGLYWKPTPTGVALFDRRDNHLGDINSYRLMDVDWSLIEAHLESCDDPLEALETLWSTAEALPERAWSSPSCAWVAHRGTQFAIRQFADGASQGAGAFWVDFGKGNPSHLLGKPIFDSSVMDNSGDINPAASEDNFVLLVGDWSRYLVVDRVGINIELVSHTFATGSNRPDGGSGYYAFKRTGAGSLDDGAFRVMSIPTAA